MSEAEKTLNHLASMPGLGHAAVDTATLKEMIKTTGGEMLLAGHLYDITNKPLGAGMFKVCTKKREFKTVHKKAVCTEPNVQEIPKSDERPLCDACGEYKYDCTCEPVKVGNLNDITGASDIEIKISDKGDRIWVNTKEHDCVLRISRITGLIVVVDDRVQATPPPSMKVFTREELDQAKEAPPRKKPMCLHCKHEIPGHEENCPLISSYLPIEEELSLIQRTRNKVNGTYATVVCPKCENFLSDPHKKFETETKVELCVACLGSET